MADQRHTHHTLRINRAPVLTLWAAVVAERLGFAVGGGAHTGTRRRRTQRLRQGQSPRSLHAHAARRPGAAPGAAREGDAEGGAPAPGRAGDAYRRGLRALSKEKPIDPATVQRYLTSKFGAALDEGLRGDAAAGHFTSASRTGGRGVIISTNSSDRLFPRARRGWGATGHIEPRGHPTARDRGRGSLTKPKAPRERPLRPHRLIPAPQMFQTCGFVTLSE